MSDASAGRTAPTVLLVGNGAAGQIGGAFARALRDLGHRFAFVDEAERFAPPGRSVLQRAFDRVTVRPAEIRRFNELVLRQAYEIEPDVVLVIGGRHLEPPTLRSIRDSGRAVLVAFATDNPLVPGPSRANVLASIPEYDVYASPRRSSLAALRANGCRRPIHVRFGYDPAVHFPEPPSPSEEEAWTSDVVFIGGADEDRVKMLEPLAASGVAVRLCGRGWERTPLAKLADGEVVDRSFRLAMAGAKIAPCLVRRSNGDGHVMRTFEVPACRQFMIAERTDEHLELFAEGVHAAYFDGPGDLCEKAQYYLPRDAERARMAEACHALVIGGRHTYRDRVREILALSTG